MTNWLQRPNRMFGPDPPQANRLEKGSDERADSTQGAYETRGACGADWRSNPVDHPLAWHHTVRRQAENLRESAAPHQASTTDVAVPARAQAMTSRPFRSGQAGHALTEGRQHLLWRR